MYLTVNNKFIDNPDAVYIVNEADSLIDLYLKNDYDKKTFFKKYKDIAAHFVCFALQEPVDFGKVAVTAVVKGFKDYYGKNDNSLNPNVAEIEFGLSIAVHSEEYLGENDQYIVDYCVNFLPWLLNQTLLINEKEGVPELNKIIFDKLEEEPFFDRQKLDPIFSVHNTAEYDFSVSAKRAERYAKRYPGTDEYDCYTPVILARTAIESLMKYYSILTDRNEEIIDALMQSKKQGIEDNISKKRENKDKTEEEIQKLVEAKWAKIDRPTDLYNETFVILADLFSEYNLITNREKRELRVIRLRGNANTHSSYAFPQFVIIHLIEVLKKCYACYIMKGKNGLFANY